MSRRTFLRAGASTGLLAALAACGSTVHSSAKDKPKPVALGSLPAEVDALPAVVVVDRTKFAMVGDSITRASVKPLTASLQQLGFTDIKIEAEVSRRIDVGDGKSEPLSGAKTMLKMISEGTAPDVWAIAMGTNDVGKYPDAAAYARLIDEMMSMPDPKLPIFWVDVYNPNQLAGTKMFNLVLRDRAKARGNATVLSWFDLASNPKAKILRDDHIHPNPAGTLVFADLVAKALA
ncbi:MAG: GDSL-type esterase/lipase family protein [Ilumatobacteraceae bacterium]